VRLGLRGQLLVVSSLLLALPFLGLRSAREVEAFLVETQEQGLTSTARAVAIALNERPGIFAAEASGAVSEDGPGADEATLHIETLDAPILLDGQVDDWEKKTGLVREIAVAATPGGATATSVRLRYRIGRHERNLFLLADVLDDSVIRYDSEFPRTEASDHLEMAMVTADDEFLRFAVHVAGDGSARVSLIGSGGSNAPDPRIEAALTETDAGYRIEARLPRTLVGSSLALAVTDVDDRGTREVVGRAQTSETTSRQTLGRIFVPSPELSALAQGLGRARSRLWVIDGQGRVLARAGTLQGTRAPQAPPTWRQQLVMELRPLYRSILVEPTEDFTDIGPDATRIEGAEITRALLGRSARWRRRTTDGRAVVLSAAEPVWSEGKVVGAVLAEETTNETLAARNRAFERLFFSIALLVAFGALTLLAFATRLSFRIRQLRDAVEKAIDRHGRVRAEMPRSRAQDEIGDLSRSFGSMLERQQQYTSYLEGLRSRLSHEIRTPVAVVRSSLDNLRLQSLPGPAAVYLDRADEGLTRLVNIMQRMTEASRLEQTLASTEREPFDLVPVVTGCVNGYRTANPGRRIDFAAETQGENALDFASPGAPIEVRLTRGLGVALLAVGNEGPKIPDDLANRQFDSMVSARPRDPSGKVHLGLGLAIVRSIADFHDAPLSAVNRRDGSGVMFSVALPLERRRA
jgi:dedicated sortase system histidine kinase